MGEYKDYGYTTNNFGCAHGFLLQPIEKLLSKESNRCILDIGCGNGVVANHLISKGYNVFGIDASESGIRIANSVNSGRFFVQDLSTEDLPAALMNNEFDTVIATEVIEHLYDPRKFVALAKDVLKRSKGDKQLIISTPFHGYLKNLAMATTGKMDAHFTALWDGGHIKFWSRKTLTALLNENAFSVIDFIGTGRIPFLWKSMIIRARLEEQR